VIYYNQTFSHIFILNYYLSRLNFKIIMLSCILCLLVVLLSKKQLYDKRNDLHFPIMNFPFIWCNIATTPAYGIYISQLIRYSSACDSYRDFFDSGLLLTRKPLNKGFLVVKLKSSLRMFHLVNGCGISVSQQIRDMFRLL